MRCHSSHAETPYTLPRGVWGFLRLNERNKTNDRAFPHSWARILLCRFLPSFRIFPRLGTTKGKHYYVTLALGGSIACVLPHGNEHLPFWFLTNNERYTPICLHDTASLNWQCTPLCGRSTASGTKPQAGAKLSYEVCHT